MKALLKAYGLSDNAIRIYLEILGKSPYYFSEIQKIIPNFSQNEINLIIDELIEKKLILCINPKYSGSLPHYLTIPPFIAILNGLNCSNNLSEDTKNNLSEEVLTLDRFQDAIYQDIEVITGELIDVISNQENVIQTAEILNEVEDNVKKFAQVILDEVIGLMTPLKMQSVIDARDLNKLITIVKQKITESDEIVSNMFTQFRDIVKEMAPPEITSQIEAFKIFIRKLGEAIERRVNQISEQSSSISLNNIQLLKKSLKNILREYINLNKSSTQKFWIINSCEKIKEVISLLINKCIMSLTIIVPDIENFIPLDKFELDYSEDLNLERINVDKKTNSNKTTHIDPSITKKQKKEIEDMLELTGKKVAEIKGFELSHYIAEVLSIVSEVNPESVIIDSIQGWLNRLLVIRKHLDSNTQYLLLENIEKWKKNYFKLKKKEKEPEKELIGELKDKISEEKSKFKGLQLQIISSEPHNNKHAIALASKANIEYLQLKHNNIIGIVGDDSYLLLGVSHQTNYKSKFEISGFFSTYKPIFEIFRDFIEDIKDKAKYPKEIEINKGFNEIIENINDYPGRKISKRLKKILNVAFEQEGISLDILELKLLVGKIEKLYNPLDDEMKQYVINELNALNKKFSTLELICPSEFRPSIIEQDNEEELYLDYTPKEIQPLDTDKIDTLFDLLIEKVDDLKGKELGEQIDKLIGVILKLQGYSEVVEWKENLKTVNETLEEPFKEKIKKDFLDWKNGILKQAISSGLSTEEDSTKIYEKSQGDKPELNKFPSVYEEEYISPGLAQSQFGSEEDSSNTEVKEKIETETGIKELFNNIQSNLRELSGIEISKLLQNIVDIILETNGYSMALKEIKDWITKLRMIRTPLEPEIKEEFEFEFLRLKEKYSNEDDKIRLDFSPSFETIEENSNETGGRNGSHLMEKFTDLINKVSTLTGNELSENLQEIADIILQSHGAIAVNVIRQWISKLRSIKECLEEETKEEFLTEIQHWKEKFA